MRYDFSRFDSHIPRMAPKPSGHHAGGQQGLGPEHGLGRLQAPNPTVCDNKSDVPWLMSLSEALSDIRALFQVRRWLRKLQKMSPALKQGGPLPGVPFPEPAVCVLSANACISPPDTKAHGSSQIRSQP